jgi:hypothetical protein
VSRSERAVRYGLIAASLGVPVATCAAEESAALPDELVTASGQLPVAAGTSALRDSMVPVTRSTWVTYRGVRPFHHEVSPENHPSDTGGGPFPSYTGDDIAGYPITGHGRLNSSLSTDPSVRIC